MSATPRSRPPGASTSARFQAYRTEDPGLGKHLMQQLIDSLKQTIPDGLEEIQTLAKTLTSRSQDVLAYFDHPRTSNARYLVGGPGWSGAGPAAVGMMSCPCP